MNPNNARKSDEKESQIHSNSAGFSYWIANNAISVYKQLPKPDENGESGQQVQRGCG